MIGKWNLNDEDRLRIDGKITPDVVLMEYNGPVVIKLTLGRVSMQASLADEEGSVARWVCVPSAEPEFVRGLFTGEITVLDLDDDGTIVDAWCVDAEKIREHLPVP